MAPAALAQLFWSSPTAVDTYGSWFSRQQCWTPVGTAPQSSTRVPRTLGFRHNLLDTNRQTQGTTTVKLTRLLGSQMTFPPLMTARYVPSSKLPAGHGPPPTPRPRPTCTVVTPR
jgi:hypothetical protein